MLKWLAKLAVFLAVTQALMPAIGQAPNHPADTGGGIQKNSNANKKPPVPPPSVGQPSQPTREQYDGSTEAGKNNPQPVAIRELPSVSVTKDWADRSYWLFSGLLVMVGGFQAYLLWRTLGAIQQQADTMERQAKESKDSGVETLAAIKEQNDNLLISAKAATVMALASNKSAKAALSQIEMMKDKERARVEIKASGLELTRVSEDFWHIKATIELRNVGMGRAYIQLGEGSLAITEEKSSGLNLDVVDGFIDPNGDPIIERLYFFQPDDASRGEYSQKICDGVFVPRITGFIEYETVGTRFHRDFAYSWIGHGSPLNVGSMFSSVGGWVPETDEDKVSSGFWSSGWIPGNNDEYEMQPQKKKRKPRQNPN